MPFNAGGQSYQGGQFLFGGLSGLGKGIGDAIENAQNQSKLESYNDSIVQHAYQAGQVDLEQLTKYRQMGHTQKTGFAASLAANFAEDMKRQQLQALQEQRQAQAELRQQQAAAFSWQPDEAARSLARATGNELVQTSPGKFTPMAYGGSGQDEVQTDPLKVAGKVIPGIGVNRKTGQYVYFPQDMGGGVKIEIEPKTGVPFYRDLKGNPKPLTGQQIMSGQMLPPDQSAAAPAGGDQGGGGGMTVGDILNAIGSIGATSPGDIPGAAQAAPSPAAATAAPQAAAATGNDVTDKRQQAIAILTQAGKPVTEANIGAVIKKLGK